MPGPLRLGELDATRREAWDAFVLACPSATFFHRAGWKEVIESAFGHQTHYLYAERDGEIVGVLPLARIRSTLFGDSLVSLPFAVYGGAAALDEDTRAALIEEAVRIGQSVGTGYIELRGLGGPQTDWYTKDLYVTFRKAIEPDPEANLLAIPRKQRAMVRKGIDAGLKSRTDQGLDDFYCMYSASVRNLGTPVFSRRYFSELQREFDKDCRILTITDENRPIASVMSFYFRDQVLPFYGGGISNARGAKANDFMYWELMRRSCEEGLRWFDFGRSKVDSGSYRFKKHWGFEAEQLYYQVKLIKSGEIPNLSPNNPKYRLMINAWRRLPLPIANFLGPFVSKYLG